MSEQIDLAEIEEHLGWIADDGEGYFGEGPHRLVCAEHLIASIPALIAWVRGARDAMEPLKYRRNLTPAEYARLREVRTLLLPRLEEKPNE